MVKTRLLLVMFVALGIAGCTLTRNIKSARLQTPPAKVTGVRLAEQTEEGARLEITVELQNPNDVALPMTSSSYSVSVAGASASLSSRPNRTIPAGGTQTVVLPAAVAVTSPISGASVTVSGTITYEPPGEIRKLLTESAVPLPATTFSFQGQVQ